MSPVKVAVCSRLKSPSCTEGLVAVEKLLELVIYGTDGYVIALFVTEMAIANNRLHIGPCEL